MGMDQERDDERGLSPSALAKLRGILVSSLSRENLSPVDLSGSALDEDIPLAPARRRRKVHFSESKSVDCLERAGAAPDAQRNSRPPSAKQGGSLHWFAHGADEPVLVNKHSGNTWLPDDTVSQVYDGSLPLNQGKENAASQRDREERLRILKEKQNEERQRKLDELKQQALAAQKFREQKEEERRRRMEELRLRDTDRRHQVEERKRQIWEAERDRREAILRKNQEREIRMETKRRNERSSIVFAFGSSTPRMLEPADTGGSYWATRRATSTSNVMMLSMSAAPGPLTRRSSERELDGSKKRATSAGGINRAKQPGEEDREEREVPDSGTVTPVPPAGTPSSRANRRRTDLMPTMPSPRDRPYSARSPGRAFSMSRLDILAQPRRPKPKEPSGPATDPSLSRSMSHLAHRPLQRKDTSRSMVQLHAPVPPPRATRAERLRRKARESAGGRAESMPTSPGVRSGDVTPSRPTSSLSMSSGAAMSMSSSVHAAFKPRPTPPARRPRPFSIAVTGVTSENSTAASTPTRHSLSAEHRAAKSPAPAPDKDKPPLPKVHVTKKPSTPKQPIEALKKPTDKVKSTKSSASPTPKATPLQSPGVETAETTVKTTVTATETVTVNGDHVTTETVSVTVSSVEVPETQTKPQEVRQEVVSQPQETVKQEVTKEQLEPATNLAECDMTASMLAKTRITTEEEAKAALAEKRRLAREQAEREAELERQRLEAERLAEEQRLREEEEEQRRMEEEQLRLLEEARQAEQERLRKAIEEKQKREEEERLQREEEERQKREKEEAERKAREEAERQRQEMEIRLKKEEEDRLLRRKRVEVIMARTRKATSANNTPTKEDGDDSPGEEPRKVNDQEQFLHSERSHSAANSTNSTNQNGHQNGVDNVVEQKNVTNNLLDLSIEGDGLGVSPLPQPITEQILTPSTNTATATNGKLVNEDSVNFNTSSTNPFIAAFQETKKQDTVNDLLS
ncbi:MAP7 domain-containing protein 1-like isoform X4 [Macrosteles quadrilineatus]|uniref:MAP7 domain-containing protein 1-like isoform X4 n=1 Tax=Macrosteles quadrilineatus TaxID=74068 RepID=UPI0023E228BE|nr:MAP7 domain-containing protein 1-like isoform X4 [Macrosteles quadrilineatus]